MGGQQQQHGLGFQLERDDSDRGMGKQLELERGDGVARLKQLQQQRNANGGSSKTNQQRQQQQQHQQPKRGSIRQSEQFEHRNFRLQQYGPVIKQRRVIIQHCFDQ